MDAQPLQSYGGTPCNKARDATSPALGQKAWREGTTLLVGRRGKIDLKCYLILGRPVMSLVHMITADGVEACLEGIPR